VLALAVVAAGTAQAHEVRPGFLELRERAPGSYDLLWKRPTGGEVEIRIAPVVPDGCVLSSPDRQQLTPGAVLVRGTLTCKGGIAGKSLRIAGLETTVTDVLVRIHHADGRLESHLLRPATPSLTLGARTTTLERSASYAQLGVQHILLGVDHLLFVLGLLLIVSDRWMLVKTITSFTVAHSLTLAVATLGYASAPLPPLNAAIALSILFLGPEIVRVWRGETSFTIRHPWVVAFAFGLLHGFGFASGLTAMGLPTAEIPLALLLFNVGVEVGQIAFVALVVLLERSFRTLEIRWPRWVEAFPGYAVGALGAFWTIQRLAALLTVLLVASPAWAHAQQGQAAGFVSGVGHPVSGLDHVLAMIAVGLWGAQLGAPAVWLLPVTFPMVMAIGGFLGLVGVPLPGVEIGVALSAVLLGLMVAREARPPLAAAAAMVGFFAIFHGHAHGTELPQGQSGLLYSVGFVIATGCLHAIGIGIGLIHRWSWGRRALRVAGAAVAIAGLWFVWRALA
jgi:hydrogenase/urease accessory protein HupE